MDRHAHICRAYRTFPPRFLGRLAYPRNLSIRSRRARRGHVDVRLAIQLFARFGIDDWCYRPCPNRRLASDTVQLSPTTVLRPIRLLGIDYRCTHGGTHNLTAAIPNTPLTRVTAASTPVARSGRCTRSAIAPGSPDVPAPPPRTDRPGLLRSRLCRATGRTR